MLWTSSYVLWANGWSMAVFALFYWIIDLRGWRRWTLPLVVIGMNAITIYLVQSQFDFSHVSRIFTGGLQKHAGSYGAAIVAFSELAAAWLFLYFLWRQRIFLKV